MTFETTNPAEETAIRTVLDALVHAVQDKDIEAMLALCAPDVAIFDMLCPLQHTGLDTIRQLWSQTLAPLAAPILCEIHELQIFVSGDVAFTHSLNRFGGSHKNGEHTSTWHRSTVGLRKDDGQWKIVHQHVSVPFDMQTGQALLDLEP